MRRHRGIVFRIPILIGISAGAAVCTSGPAVAATRDLTGYGGPAVTFTVTINLEPPDGTILAAIEEAPPAGWDIENISDNGTWDTGTEQIKWGPFFDPSIPPAVSYDLTPPAEVAGLHCFSGTVTFETESDAIGGDLCLPPGVPSISGRGIATLALLVLGTGTLILRRTVGIEMT